MSVLIQNVRDQVIRLPRAVQWALATAVFVVAFLAWDSTVRPVSARWQSAADNIEHDISRIAEARTLATQLRRMHSTIASVGPVEMPAGSAASQEALTNAVNEVLAAHTTSGDSFQSRVDRKFPKRFLTTITKSQNRIEAIRGDLSFEATPEEAVDIIAALESHPAIECIRSLQLINAGNGRLEVRMSLEAWAMSEDKA